MIFLKHLLSIILVISIWSISHGQHSLTLDEAIQYALSNNIEIQSSSLAIDHQQQLKRASGEIPKTDISLMHGQYNSYVKSDNSISITQTIPFPTVFTSQNGLAKARLLSSEIQKQNIQNNLVYKVSVTFYQLLYLEAKQKLLLKQDSIFSELARASQIRYETGESNLLEKISAETQWNEVKNQLQQNEADMAIHQRQLQTYLNSEQVVNVNGDLENLLSLDKEGLDVNSNPGIKFTQQQEVIAGYQKKVESAKFLPDIHVGYFNQSLIGFQNVNGSEQYFGSSDRFQGFQVGLSIPIWFVPNAAKVKAASSSAPARSSGPPTSRIVPRSPAWSRRPSRAENRRSARRAPT
jgi:cobalt-zinc-cadmium resistance protein CzcA